MNFALSALILFCCISVFSQNQAEEVENRIKRIETQIQSLNEELNSLKTKIAAAKTTDTPEKKADTPKTAGIELEGGTRIVPYGTVYFNVFGNSAGTNNSDIPLFATQSGKGNVSASVRQTRLGLRLEGGRIGNAKLSGVVEADFFGGSPAIGIGENFGVVRVRLANARLDWKDTSVVVGQDWIPFAPQNPVSIADAAIPQFAAAGNNWARLPQAKIEQRFYKGQVSLQGAVLAPQTGDSNSTANFLQQPNSGALSRLPFFQGRFSYNSKNWLATKKSGTIGLSAHYGRSRVTSTSPPILEEDVDSYAVALDWNFPIHKRVTWSGEGFFGRNLGGFQGGVFQNYNTDYAERQGSLLIGKGTRGIGTSGGWTQIGFTPNWKNDRLTFYGSFGLDDPKNSDLVNLRGRDFRNRNFAWAFDAIYKFTPQFQIGLEFRQLNTTYNQSGKKRANHINLGAAYGF